MKGNGNITSDGTSDGNPLILSYSIPKGSFKSIPRLKLHDLTESGGTNGSFRWNICSARVNRLRYPDLIEVRLEIYLAKGHLRLS